MQGRKPVHSVSLAFLFDGQNYSFSNILFPVLSQQVGRGSHGIRTLESATSDKLELRQAEREDGDDSWRTQMQTVIRAVNAVRQSASRFGCDVLSSLIAKSV